MFQYAADEDEVEDEDEDTPLTPLGLEILTVLFPSLVPTSQ